LFFKIDPVDMGVAQYFSVFANMSVVQGTGASGTLNGAVASGTSLTLDSAFTIDGMTFTSDSTTLQVAKDLTAAMADCSGRDNQTLLTSNDLDTLVLAPGVYQCGESMALNDGGVLTLDAVHNANAVWIFNIRGGVTFAGSVTLINYPGSDVPVWWNVAGGADKSISIGTGATVKGHVMSTVNVNVLIDSEATVGSLLTLGSVTFNQGSSVTSQARTYPNSYAGVIGERSCVLC
jgi:hypothetical protein